MSDPVLKSICEAQIVILKYHLSIKRNWGFLEKWLIVDIGQEMYRMILEHCETR